MRRIFLAALLVLFGASVTAAQANPAQANSAQAGPQGKAAALYAQGDYNAAYKQYLKMAREGDTFSQYRLSYMNLKGLGTDSNVVDAMAWAVLAAEGGHDSLERYQSAVAAMVPGDQRKKAQKRADYYLRRWGREDRGGGRTLASTAEGSCTGSRLAANCGQATQGPAKWISWSEDRSADPEQHRHIEALNEAIVENSAQLSGGNPG